MVSLKSILLFFLLFFCSCAKVEYLWDQGTGQIKILTKAKENQKILNDVTIRPEYKTKIKLIMKYKKYFYHYWEKETSEIYNKTYFLDQKAVTYLVIASPYNKIEARKECFPFMGCFPYLGFFSKEKALEFAADLESEQWVTYTRPVYAYSSLGYFSDPILSSFFYYDERQLAELIFHELFHTIFFAKNEVNFNENLANFFAKEMVTEYFKDDKKKLHLMNQKKRDRKKVNQKIVSFVKELNNKYELKKPKDKLAANSLFNDFIKNSFIPNLSKFCIKEGIEPCYGLKREWNNASFVAFLTYEEQESKINTLQGGLGLNLKDFFDYIVEKYKNFEDSDTDTGFEQYIFKK